MCLGFSLLSFPEGEGRAKERGKKTVSLDSIVSSSFSPTSPPQPKLASKSVNRAKQYAPSKMNRHTRPRKFTRTHGLRKKPFSPKRRTSLEKSDVERQKQISWDTSTPTQDYTEGFPISPYPPILPFFTFRSTIHWAPSRQTKEITTIPFSIPACLPRLT